MESGSDARGIFAGCRIAFVPSTLLTASEIAELSKWLRENGSVVVEPRKDGSIAMDEVTHVVSKTIDFPQYSEAQDLMVHVVDSQWVVSSIKRRKVATARQYSPDPRMIFSKVTVTCADLPTLDKETIKGSVEALGGIETTDLTRLTTHICALTMDHPKCATAKGDPRVRIVLPHWFFDCFKLGKRIDETPYLLPDPEILRKAQDEDLGIPPNRGLEGACSATPDYLPAPSETDSSSRPLLTVFAHRSVLLSEDLPLTARLRKIISDLIEDGGGRIVEPAADCDMLVCHFRDGEDYVTASRSGKAVGNLAWLYHLITNNEWTSPMRRLLHYPIPRDGVPGFGSLVITLSNYGGEARVYLENLIKAAGATYTKAMRSENTHLITARMSGDKCSAAETWNVAVVNHLWIEESYAKCELLQATGKYLCFPKRTNLGEITGQTFFDEARLREKYYPDDEGRKPLRVGGGGKKRRSSGRHDAARAAATSSPGEERNARTSARHSEDVEMLDATEEPPRKKRKSGAAAAAAAPEAVTTPARPGPSGGHGGKENHTPSVASAGSRSAKNKALASLHDMVPDLALYEKEKRRAGRDGNGPWGGRRAADQVERELINRSSSPAQDRRDTPGDDEDSGGDDENDDGDDARPPKKARPQLPAVQMRVVLTGFERWVGVDKAKEDRERKKLRDLGILIVQETQACDYLAAPHVVRTVKFLVALARGPTVISCNFIDKTLETGKLAPVDDFTLHDSDAEERFGFKLETTISRARAHRGKLLQGVPIFCTDSIRNGTSSYKSIAEANGAIFQIYKGRACTIKPTTAEEDGGAPPDPVYLLSSNTPEERVMWARFAEMAEKGHMLARIVAADWLLDVVLRQEVTFDEKFLTKNFWDPV